MMNKKGGDVGRSNLAGNITRQKELRKGGESKATHLETIGRMIEDMEIDMVRVVVLNQKRRYHLNLHVHPYVNFRAPSSRVSSLLASLASFAQRSNMHALYIQKTGEVLNGIRSMGGGGPKQGASHTLSLNEAIMKRGLARKDGAGR